MVAVFIIAGPGSVELREVQHTPNKVTIIKAIPHSERTRKDAANTSNDIPYRKIDLLRQTLTDPTNNDKEVFVYWPSDWDVAWGMDEFRLHIAKSEPHLHFLGNYFLKENDD